MDREEVFEWVDAQRKSWFQMCKGAAMERFGWLISEVDRLTAANADLHQRLDAAEEALKVAQGEALLLRKINRAYRRVYHGHKAQITAANSRVERLREALERVEWAEDGDPVFCLWCGALKDEGHFSHCDRQSALADDAKEVKGGK